MAAVPHPPLCSFILVLTAVSDLDLYCLLGSASHNTWGYYGVTLVVVCKNDKRCRQQNKYMSQMGASNHDKPYISTSFNLLFKTLTKLLANVKLKFLS